MRTLIAVPCMDTVQTRFMISLMMMKRTEDFCNFYFYMNSLTYDARNSITKEAIEEGYDRVLWLDSDMSFGPELMEQLGRRIDEGRDFVSGLYFERKPPHRPTIYRALMATERDRSERIRRRDDDGEAAAGCDETIRAAVYADHRVRRGHGVLHPGEGSGVQTVVRQRDPRRAHRRKDLRRRRLGGKET